MDWTKVKNVFDRIKGDGKKPALASKLEEVCVFPLSNVVLLPGVVLPLHIFEERYKLMTEYLLSHNKHLAMSLINPGSVDLKPNAICGAGTLSVLERFPDGRSNVVVEANSRLKIIKIVQEKPYIRALAETVPDIPFESPVEEQSYHQKLNRLVLRYIFLSPELNDGYMDYINLFPKPHHLADFVGFYFLPTSHEKQQLLEMTHQKSRVEKIMGFLTERIKQIESFSGQEELSDLGPKNYH